MSNKRKYPKSFYDDGLGDILEWIDDEVLIHSELGNKDDRTTKASKTKSEKAKKKSRLYGDNVLPEDNILVPKRVKPDLVDDEVELKADKKLEDRTRGLINRLAAQTMPFVTSELAKIYSTNSRSAVNIALFNNIETAVVNSHALTKRKLIAELMLLMSYLSHSISNDIGASLVHRLVRRFETLYKEPNNEEDKSIDNVVCCILNLYIVGLISANIIFEITKRICQGDFKPKSVELLLLIFRSVGFQLRKDNPQQMRQLIITSQDNCKRLKTDSELGSRVEFMMEALGAIKNNNVSKIGNYGCDIDRDTIESCLKNLVKRTKLPESLSDATYEEMLKSSNFYLLETRLNEGENPDAKKTTQLKEACSTNDQKICKALGLTRPSEKTVLSALLRASDYVEASNTIIGFGLNHCSDAMTVCIHVAIYEKKYNPFHFDLINNLCKFNRRYKMATKFSIQDKIRVLGKMPTERVKIFKQLCLELIKADAIPITILKSVEWADLSPSTKEFLVHLLENISDLDEEEKRKIMSKADKRSTFAGAMRTFTNCFLKGCELFR